MEADLVRLNLNRLTAMYRMCVGLLYQFSA